MLSQGTLRRTASTESLFGGPAAKGARGAQSTEPVQVQRESADSLRVSVGLGAGHCARARARPRPTACALCRVCWTPPRLRWWAGRTAHRTERREGSVLSRTPFPTISHL